MQFLVNFLSKFDFRSLSAELRGQIRAGISGLGLPGSRPATTVPVLGDETRRILGVKEDSDNDSAIDDPNTESLASRPRGGKVVPELQVFPVRLSVPIPSPPAKMAGEKPLVTGVSQLRKSKSPGES